MESRIMLDTLSLLSIILRPADEGLSYGMALNETEIDRIVESADEISTDDTQFLAMLGSRVRELRERRGMSRKLLARESRVSERYLGQLESGNGNISVVLLRRVASALGVTVSEVLIPEEQDTAERRLIRRFLEPLAVHRRQVVILRLML